jgi:hypothetical protein
MLRSHWRAAACEVQLRGHLVNAKGEAPKGTCGRILMLKKGYETFDRKHAPRKLS